MRTTALLILAIFLTGCASAPEPTENYSIPESDNFAGIQNGNLVYIGGLSEERNEALFTAYEQAEVKPERLLVSSTGGDVMLGLDLGEWIAANNLDVEVLDLCASSCANYIFPAGQTKYLRKYSILLWHGSAWQESLDDNKDQGVTEWKIRETAFFRDISVDNIVTVFGWKKRRGLDFLFHQIRYRSPRLYGFDYSLQDMERMGLSNTVLVDGEWNWRKYQPDYAADIIRVSLENEYVKTLGRFQVHEY